MNTSPEDITWSLVREKFPALNQLVYLDSAAWGLQHQQVSTVLKEYLDFTTERGVLSKEHLAFWESGQLSSEAKEKYAAIATWQGVEALRKECASVLGVKRPDDVSWRMNTTEAFETVTRMVRWKEGDNLIITDLEHESISNVCEMLKEIRLVELKRANAETLLPSADFENRLINRIIGQITDRTKMIVFSHIFFCCGQVIDPGRVVGAIRQHAPPGTLIVVDGAHALGKIPLEVDAYACDAYVTGGSKWLLAPAGSGILYVSPAALDFYQYIVWPLSMYESAPQHKQTVGKKPGIETGLSEKEITRGATPQLPLIGLHAALLQYQNLTPSRVSGRIRELTGIARATLGTIRSLSIERCENTQTGMLFLTRDDWNMTDVINLARRLKDKGVCTSAIRKPPSLRVSIHYYNNEEEFKQLVRHLYTEGIT